MCFCDVSFDTYLKEVPMLGELLGEEKGKRTTIRVVKSDGGQKVEVTFQAEGAILGLRYTQSAPIPRRGAQAVFCLARGRV